MDKLINDEYVLCDLNYKFNNNSTINILNSKLQIISDENIELKKQINDLKKSIQDIELKKINDLKKSIEDIKFDFTKKFLLLFQEFEK